MVDVGRDGGSFQRTCLCGHWRGRGGGVPSRGTRTSRGWVGCFCARGGGLPACGCAGGLFVVFSRAGLGKIDEAGMSAEFGSFCVMCCFMCGRDVEMQVKENVDHPNS